MSDTDKKAAIQVATNALRADAGVWAEQGVALGNVVPQVEDLRLSRIEAGIFQVMVGPYDTLAGQLTERCREGSKRLAEVSDTLRKVADVYDAEEARNEHVLRNLY